MLKVGDFVTIKSNCKELLKDSTFGYTDAMSEFEGAIAEIVSIVYGQKHINDNSYAYRLDIDNGEWFWDESALELIKTNDTIDTEEKLSSGCLTDDFWITFAKNNLDTFIQYCIIDREMSVLEVSEIIDIPVADIKNKIKNWIRVNTKN